MAVALRVVATAGHVDHGKSSLIIRLTGIDPDRFAEEKRRGLTIDLGYAWCTLPSGREIGFVDVPGHERFIRNMLAGVGPVRLVLFVVAADEGWKPQSEEHLQILDILGSVGGVIALTKRDLVDERALKTISDDIRERIRGTTLAGSPIVAVSARTGEGIDELRLALDSMIAEAPLPPEAPARLFVDRVFTIKGAGTVVTGTLVGDCLAVSEEVQLYPSGRLARIRSLQTHKQSEDRACPVTRVAANLVGVEREELERGDVLGPPATLRATQVFEAVLRPVRGVEHPITARGAYQVHAGAAEADATVRILGQPSVAPDGEAFVRIRTSRPLVLEVFDRFVLREAGRGETVGGGEVLDIEPPARARDAHLRLSARAAASREDLPRLLTMERGAVSVDDAAMLTGTTTPAPLTLGGLFVREDVPGAAESALTQALAAHHLEHPLDEGADLAFARAAVVAALKPIGAPTDLTLADTLLDDFVTRGIVVRTGAALRLPAHRVTLDASTPEIERLLAVVGGGREATPPSLEELRSGGFDRDAIEAAARAGLVVRVPPDLVFLPSFIAKAQEAIAAASASGITVSAFREQLGTTRKYAVPLLEWFDQRGITRRTGDRRFPVSRPQP
ncbi:MAG: selenocysteine-specific translation elongation factor [Actinomycetota bacterium]|nr:selenocysteine-specific translation elongation factor [Actinomycetota bacterium]